MKLQPQLEIQTLGDAALILEWGVPSDQALTMVQAAAARLAEAQIVGLIEVVPGMETLAVYYDPHIVDEPSIRSNLQSTLRRGGGRAKFSARRVDIPVCYDSEFALDADRVSDHCGLSFDEVVRRHAARQYVVQMIGFAPGFCYLVGLDPALHVPRLPVPRTQVPAGSVAIGHDQTGVYPTELPGGWNVIGRTPLTLFWPEKDPPTRLLPGDSVRFVPVSRAELDSMRDA